MKLIKKTAITSALVLGTLGLGSASAITLDNIPGVTGTNLQVQVDNDVATLFGQADSGADKNIAERHVAKIEGVDRIINLVTFQ